MRMAPKDSYVCILYLFNELLSSLERIRTCDLVEVSVLCTARAGLGGFKGTWQAQCLLTLPAARR